MDPLRRSDEEGISGEARSIENELTILDSLRNAKIRDLDPSLVVDENIGALNVAMDNLPLVEVVESSKNLADELAHERLLEGAVVGQQSGN